MTVRDILERMAEILEPEGSWAQKADAYRRDGIRCTAHDLNAASWCIRGAMMKAISDTRHQGLLAPDATSVLKVLREVLAAEFNDIMGRRSIFGDLPLSADPIWWNDMNGRTHEDVRLLLKKAIYRAEVEE